MDPSPGGEVPITKPRRPITLTLGAITCWLVGTHLALPVPGVILFMLVGACLTDGWRNILATAPGRILMLMIGLSSLSTATWMIAGWHFFKVSRRRGWVHVGVAVGSAILTALLFFFL